MHCSTDPTPLLGMVHVQLIDVPGPSYCLPTISPTHDITQLPTGSSRLHGCPHHPLTDTNLGRPHPQKKRPASSAHTTPAAEAGSLRARLPWHPLQRGLAAAAEASHQHLGLSHRAAATPGGGRTSSVPAAGPLYFGNPTPKHSWVTSWKRSSERDTSASSLHARPWVMPS